MATKLPLRIVAGIVLLALSLSPIVPAAAKGTAATSASPGWHSLTGWLPLNRSIQQWRISPNSQSVVFISDLETVGRPELYSVAITGTQPIKINGPFQEGGAADDFEFTPDSQYVIYSGRQGAGAATKLYRARLDGGGSVEEISDTMVAEGNVTFFKVDPDNQRVVYLADQDTDDVFELFSVLIGGGLVTKLNPTLVSGGDVNGSFQIERISNRVIYGADQETNGRTELYSVAIGGGPTTKLTPDNASSVYDFELSPSLPMLAFSLVPNGSPSKQVYSQAAAGGLLQTLNFGLAANQDVFGYHFSPDGSHVVYNVTTMTATTPVQSGNLYSVLIGGGPSTLLTEAADPAFGVYGGTFWFTPDSQRVVYLYQKQALQGKRVESVTLAGTGRVTLCTNGVHSTLQNFLLSANGQFVLCYNNIKVLSTVPTTGGATSSLGIGYLAQLLPDSSRVIYVTPSADDDLISDAVTGGDKLNLSQSGTTVNLSSYAKFSPDSQWIAFEVQMNVNGGTLRDLRVSDGNAAPPKLFLPAVRR
ncbi:MAG: hypothetical protein ABI847_00575 [Anaerolineales bacterium]